MGSDGSMSPGATCAVCGGAAAVYCVADAAALCGACDAVVHVANLLASRHERVPLASAAAAFGVYDDQFTADDVVAASSWTTMLPPPPAPGQGSPQGSSEASFSTSSEEGSGANLFDLISVDVDLAVCPTGAGHLPNGAAPVHHHRAAAAPFWAPPVLAAWTPADAATVVVPGAGAAVIAAGAEREARVQRYREKRKNRRFKKTIRYASRKAYAEARPRIKGRFVKRDPAVAAPDSDAAKFWFSDDAPDDGVGFYAAGAYGVVPSF
jgi:hypothetical protein